MQCSLSEWQWLLGKQLALVLLGRLSIAWHMVLSAVVHSESTQATLLGTQLSPRSFAWQCFLMLAVSCCMPLLVAIGSGWQICLSLACLAGKAWQPAPPHCKPCRTGGQARATLGGGTGSGWRALPHGSGSRTPSGIGRRAPGGNGSGRRALGGSKRSKSLQCHNRSRNKRSRSLQS